MAKKKLANYYDNNRPIEFDFNLSEKQFQALITEATEVFFGGSKGSGKSHLIRYATIIYSLAIIVQKSIIIIVNILKWLHFDKISVCLTSVILCSNI